MTPSTIVQRTLRRAVKVAAMDRRPRFVIPTGYGPRIDTRPPARLTNHYRVEPWGQVTLHSWDFPAVGEPTETVAYCV